MEQVRTLTLLREVEASIHKVLKNDLFDALLICQQNDKAEESKIEKLYIEDSRTEIALSSYVMGILLDPSKKVDLPGGWLHKLVLQGQKCRNIFEAQWFKKKYAISNLSGDDLHSRSSLYIVHSHKEPT